MLVWKRSRGGHRRQTFFLPITKARRISLDIYSGNFALLRVFLFGLIFFKFYFPFFTHFLWFFALRINNFRAFVARDVRCETEKQYKSLMSLGRSFYSFGYGGIPKMPPRILIQIPLPHSGQDYSHPAASFSFYFEMFA